MSFFTGKTFGDANARALNAMYAAYADTLDTTLEGVGAPHCKPFAHRLTNDAPALADWITLHYGIRPAGPQSLAMHMPADAATPTAKELIACFFPEPEAFAAMPRDLVVRELEQRVLALRESLYARFAA